MGLGLGYTWVFDETSKFTLALDVNKLLVPSAPVPTDPEDPVKKILPTSQTTGI